MLLAQAFRTASPLREDRDGVATTGELDRGLYGAEIAHPATNRETAEPACDVAEQRHEQLGLRHPPELAWEERVRKGESVEIRELVR